MRIFPLGILISLLFFSCQPETPQQKQAHNESLQLLFTDYWDTYAALHPLTATSAGINTYNDRLGEVGEEAEQRKKKEYQVFLERLAKIDRNELTEKEQINYDLFKFVLDDQIAAIDFERYLVPISSDGGFHVNLVYMVNNMPFDSPKDYQNYLSRLLAIPDYVDQQISLLRKGMEKGMTLPKVVLDNYTASIDVHQVDEISESKFYGPFLKMPETMAEGQKNEIQSTARQYIIKHVNPALAAFSQFINEEYEPGAVEAIGISSQPKGKDFYEQQVRYFSTLPLTADEIFETGKKEVARIRTDMDAVLETLDYQGSFENFLEFLRTDSRFYAETARELLKEASYIAKRVDGKLPQYFNQLPDLPYGVSPVPEAIAPKYTTGRYSPGSAANHKAGFYWVNTFKLKSRPLYALPALTLHEAVPGHHLQISLAQELEDVPEFRRHNYISSYGEGWALYCEWLGQEMGIYEDPYQDFGRLTYEMWRACRLVVDIGIHLKGWSRQQAVDYLASNTALSIHEVNTEIDRYIGWPGQALSYKIGELKIRELRKKAEKALGENFDLRAFHDEILRHGAMPLFTLEKQVTAWIEGVVGGVQ